MPDLAGDVVEQTETTLLALLDAILAAHQGINEERISIEGDDLPIGPHALTTIALLLHELATNAVKYGGLATPEGQLRIEVGIAGERMKSNRCTDPTYSGWFLRGRSARDVEDLEQWLTKLMRCQTLV